MGFGKEQPEELNNVEKKEDMPWVQDIIKEEADEMIEKMNIKIETGEIESPEGSEYKIGPSKSGNENEVGIYFSDPTASKESENNSDSLTDGFGELKHSVGSKEYEKMMKDHSNSNKTEDLNKDSGAANETLEKLKEKIRNEQKSENE